MSGLGPLHSIGSTLMCFLVRGIGCRKSDPCPSSPDSTRFVAGPPSFPINEFYEC